jgi:hypothetical protein
MSRGMQKERVIAKRKSNSKKRESYHVHYQAHSLKIHPMCNLLEGKKDKVILFCYIESSWTLSREKGDELVLAS